MANDSRILVMDPFAFIIFDHACGWLLYKLPLHHLQPAHVILHFSLIDIRHHALRGQILPCLLAAFVIDVFAVILPALQGFLHLTVLAQFNLILPSTPGRFCSGSFPHAL